MVKTMTGYELYKSLLSNRHIIDNECGYGYYANYCVITLKGDWVTIVGCYDGGLHAWDRCPGDNGAGYLDGTSWMYSIHLANLPVEERLEVIRHPKRVVDIEAHDSGFDPIMPYMGWKVTDDYYLD